MIICMYILSKPHPTVVISAVIGAIIGVVISAVIGAVITCQCSSNVNKPFTFFVLASHFCIATHLKRASRFFSSPSRSLPRSVSNLEGRSVPATPQLTRNGPIGVHVRSVTHQHAHTPLTHSLPGRLNCVPSYCQLVPGS